MQLFFGFSIPDSSRYATNIWIFRRLLEQLGLKSEARRRGRAQSRCVWIKQDSWDELLLVLSQRQAKREALAGNSSPVTLIEPLLANTSNVVTPSYIYKSEGVTTDPERQTAQKAKLSLQALQTGVELLGLIAKTEAVEELEIFDCSPLFLLRL